jgi:hypothetical protein
MNIKSLLIGSAAVLVAATGARAADVIVADPEPVDYVRVCDTYGAGFFYIPGTETCLKIGGFVRYDVNINRNGWTKNTRGQLTIDAREETEYGTLRGFIAFQGNSTPTVVGNVANTGSVSFANVANVILDSAFIEIGAAGGVLHIGFSDNAFDAGISGEFDALGGAKTNRIAYSFSAGALSGSISIDDDANGDFTPNVSGNIGGTFGPAAVRVYAAYDNNTKNWAVKGIASAKATDMVTLELAGVYANGPSYVGPVARYSIAGDIVVQANAKVKLVAGAQYDDRFGFAVGVNRWVVGGHVDFKPTPNFLIRGAIQHAKVSNVATGATTGYIRFQRDF